MRKHGHLTNIGSFKLLNMSKGASINYGPAFHKNYQANSKINTGEIVIGDEFSFGCPCPPEENNGGQKNSTV